MANDRWWLKAMAVVLAAALSAAAAEPPLTAADVARFLSAGISESTILTELKARGFAEPLDSARENTLRAAGATETLLVALRRAAPAGAPSAEPTTSDGVPIAPGATSPAGAARPTGLTFAASARSVRVPVSVLDKRGQPVLGLSEADFKLSEDGRQQPVTFFSGERQPLKIALALDVSASMRDKLDEVSESLRQFVDLLEPADKIMVITFSGRVHIDQDFTSNREDVDRVFDRLRTDQGTALYDAAAEAIRRVAKEPAESKAVVLVTDGVDTASMTTFDEVRELARRSEVPVFSIGIEGLSGIRSLMTPRRPPMGGGWPGGGGRGWPGRGWPGGGGRGWPMPPGGGGGYGPERDFDARPLLDLADDSGARAEIVKAEAGSSGKLKSAVESIVVTLRHRYLVGYEPDPGKPGWRKIRVEVDRPSTKVQARKGYYAEG
jgi:VWFA-related protein